MTAKELLDSITDSLLANPIFKDFHVRKKDHSIIYKNKMVTKSLEFKILVFSERIWIIPYYFIRYEVLRKWFETHSHKSITDQKKIASFTYFGKKLNVQDTFKFNKDWSNYVEEFQIMESTIIKSSEYVFNKLGTLKGCYSEIIAPIIKNHCKLQDVGFEWVVDMTALCKIVNPDAYACFKNIVLNQIEYMHRKNEPNVEMYYNKLDDIFADLESQDFSEMKIE